MNPKTREKGIVIQNLDDEILVYDLESNKAFCLNKTTSAIWQKCTGELSVEAIVPEVQKDFGTSVTKELVALAIEQLKNDNLLESGENVSTILDGLSRREMVRRVGFMSVVALPLVSSLVAPNAINAMSVTCPAPGGAPTCPCTTNGSCDDNCCDMDNSGTCLSPANQNYIANGSPCDRNCICISNACPPATMGNPRVCV